MKAKLNMGFQLYNDKLETLEQVGIDVYLTFNNQNTFEHLKKGLGTMSNIMGDVIQSTDIEKGVKADESE